MTTKPVVNVGTVGHIDHKIIIIGGGLPRECLTGSIGFIESFRFIDMAYEADPVTPARPRKYTDVPFWCKKHK